MSNASLKEQLQAVASQLSVTVSKESVSKEKVNREVKRSNSNPAKPPISNKFHKPHHTKPTTSRPPISKPMASPKKPKPKWLDYVQYGVALLKTHFPLCFHSPAEVKPLKKGIKQDLIQRLSTIETVVTEDKACMVKSLSFYVNTMAYHKKVLLGVARIDLDGNPAGEVSAEEATYSQEKILAKSKPKLPVATTTTLPAECAEEIA